MASRWRLLISILGVLLRIGGVLGSGLGMKSLAFVRVQQPLSSVGLTPCFPFRGLESHPRDPDTHVVKSLAYVRVQQPFLLPVRLTPFYWFPFPGLESHPRDPNTQRDPNTHVVQSLAYVRVQQPFLAPVRLTPLYKGSLRGIKVSKAIHVTFTRMW